VWEKGETINKHKRVVAWIRLYLIFRVFLFPRFAFHFLPLEFFRELLENSKRDFHDMFKRTYGILYEQNSEVFTDLFRDLEDYYARGKLDLEEAMDHFFTALYQRMFTVLNAQFRFDDKYIKKANKKSNRTTLL
jgi:hypothetical protein